MADHSGIEWTQATWNPVTGCDRISPGCDNCYALTLAKRLKAMGAPKYQHDGDPRTAGPGFALTIHPTALTIPLRWRTPRTVFVNSMSDLFHARVPVPFIAAVFAVMRAADQHTFQVLTKRATRMRSVLSNEDFRGHYNAALRELAPGLAHTVWPLPNVWLGVSVEDQQRAEQRIPALLATPAAIRFLSCEPLLGPVDLGRWFKRPQHACDRCHQHGPLDWDSAHLWGTCHCGCHPNPTTRPDWVIAGGESGPNARPINPAWPAELRDLCQAAQVPFFFKQWGGRTPKSGGRVLDGRTWDQHPRLSA